MHRAGGAHDPWQAGVAAYAWATQQLQHSSLGQSPGCHGLNRSVQTGKGGEGRWSRILQMGTTLGERMGSKDEPQLSPLGGALGRQEKAVGNVLPQSTQLIPGKGKLWWLYLLQLKRSHQGKGRGAGCQGESSAKAVAPQGATEHGAEPRCKQHKQGFPETPQNSPYLLPSPRGKGKPQQPWKSRGAQGAAGRKE